MASGPDTLGKFWCHKTKGGRKARKAWKAWRGGATGPVLWGLECECWVQSLNRGEKPVVRPERPCGGVPWAGAPGAGCLGSMSPLPLTTSATVGTPPLCNGATVHGEQCLSLQLHALIIYNCCLRHPCDDDRRHVPGEWPLAHPSIAFSAAHSVKNMSQDSGWPETRVRGRQCHQERNPNLYKQFTERAPEAPPLMLP